MRLDGTTSSVFCVSIRINQNIFIMIKLKCSFFSNNHRVL